MGSPGLPHHHGPLHTAPPWVNVDERLPERLPAALSTGPLKWKTQVLLPRPGGTDDKMTVKWVCLSCFLFFSILNLAHGASGRLYGKSSVNSLIWFSATEWKCDCVQSSLSCHLLPGETFGKVRLIFDACQWWETVHFTSMMILNETFRHCLTTGLTLGDNNVSCASNSKLQLADSELHLVIKLLLLPLLMP